MKSTWVVTAAVAAAFLAAPRVRAQLADVPTGATSAPTSLATRGPTMQTAAIAPHFELPGESDPALAAARRPFGFSQTLMIVGGAAFVAGALIGDDAGTVLMVAGAGVGLYGLYLYLRQPSGSDSRAVGVGYSIPVSP